MIGSIQNSPISRNRGHAGKDIHGLGHGGSGKQSRLNEVILPDNQCINRAAFAFIRIKCAYQDSAVSPDPEFSFMVMKW